MCHAVVHVLCPSLISVLLNSNRAMHLSITGLHALNLQFISDAVKYDYPAVNPPLTKACLVFCCCSKYGMLHC